MLEITAIGALTLVACVSLARLLTVKDEHEDAMMRINERIAADDALKQIVSSKKVRR